METAIVIVSIIIIIVVKRVAIDITVMGWSEYITIVAITGVLNYR